MEGICILWMFVAAFYFVCLIVMLYSVADEDLMILQLGSTYFYVNAVFVFVIHTNDHPLTVRTRRLTSHFKSLDRLKGLRTCD